MNTEPTATDKPESLPRVIFCRLFSIAAVLSLWHIPDPAAAAIYCVGAAAFYFPYPAVPRSPAPRWLRPVWLVVAAGIFAAYIFFPSPAPAGSVMPPALKYGCLALIAVQVAFDLYRRQRRAELKRHARQD
jgi:hypothetical protein